ncbi:hypothetical protein FOZ63_017394, partial [Perkinsus olseni]
VGIHHKNWAERSTSDDSFPHSMHQGGPPGKRVRLRRNDGSPSATGEAKTEIVDFRTWMSPRQVAPAAEQTPKRSTPILLNRSAAEAGEAAATMAIQQQQQQGQYSVPPPPPPPPPPSSYFGKGHR